MNKRNISYDNLGSPPKIENYRLHFNQLDLYMELVCFIKRVKYRIPCEIFLRENVLRASSTTTEDQLAQCPTHVLILENLQPSMTRSHPQVEKFEPYVKF
jgi:hypothetical protein